MLYFIILLALFTVFFKYGYKIKQCVQLYRNYKSFVDPNNKLSHIQIIRNLFSLFFSILYSTYSLYYMTNTKKEKESAKFNKKYLKISYKYRDKTYFYLLKIPRGVQPLKNIVDEDGNDISDIINPYLGPNLDCHGALIYPKDFGYNQIKITTVFDKTIVFDEDQKIELTDD